MGQRIEKNMSKFLYLLIVLFIVGCGKDEVLKTNENPYSKKRPSKINIIGKSEIIDYNFRYEDNKLIQIKLSKSSSDYTEIYNQDYNFRYSGDTVIMTTQETGGAENYAFEHKYLIDEKRMAVYSKRGTKYLSPEMRWSSYSDVFLLKSGRIDEYIHNDTYEKTTKRFFYTGDRLTKTLEDNGKEILFRYDGDLVYKEGCFSRTIVGKIKNGKIVDFEGGAMKLTYTSDDLLSEIEIQDYYDAYKFKYFYESGSADIEFLQLDFDGHFEEFTLNPLFDFFNFCGVWF